MKKTPKLVSIQDQFNAKETSHKAAASCCFEEKFAKLLELQKISSELARKAGLPAKEPWNIPT